MKINRMIEELERVREEFGDIEVFIAKLNYSQEAYLVEQSTMCHDNLSNSTCAKRCEMPNCKNNCFEGVIIH